MLLSNRKTTFVLKTLLPTGAYKQHKATSFKHLHTFTHIHIHKTICFHSAWRVYSRKLLQLKTPFKPTCVGKYTFECRLLFTLYCTPEHINAHKATNVYLYAFALLLEHCIAILLTHWKFHKKRLLVLTQF